ncbi:hypothetical protein WHZ76_10045 [Citrobacter portucalensis]|uniref:hypothetical protein n=1 Tax=Citrobacter portucalensis TaxID=1639133 RepID=UPI00339BF06D
MTTITRFTKEQLQEIAELARKATYKPCAMHMTNLLVVCDSEVIEEMARQLLASMEQEPVSYTCSDALDDVYCGSAAMMGPAGAVGEVPLYAAPQLPQPAVLSVSEGVLKSLLPDVEKSEFWFEHNGKIFFEGVRFNNAVFEAYRATMLKSFGNSEQLDEVGSWDNHMNTPTDKPAINTDELLKHIEGMEVSVDVSTCDADAGHRYFGTVTEISELDTARNGYILLVQDAKPNFKPAGNSPATPDGWQLVPKEPTEAMNKAGWAAMNEHDAINPTYRAMLAAAPQQDVRLALEIGMSRYAGAMQKLVDSGD